MAGAATTFVVLMTIIPGTYKVDGIDRTIPADPNQNYTRTLDKTFSSQEDCLRRIQFMAAMAKSLGAFNLKCVASDSDEARAAVPAKQQ